MPTQTNSLTREGHSMSPRRTPSASVCKRIFVIVPFGPTDPPYYQSIEDAVAKVNAQLNISIIVSRAGATHPMLSASPTDEIQGAIQGADVVVADVTGARPNIMYELGFARALGKPVIYIAKKLDEIPFDLTWSEIELYGEYLRPEAFTSSLAASIAAAMRSPKKSTDAAVEKRKRRRVPKPSVFISYSHADATYLERLLVHLKPVSRESSIEIWADTKIEAGTKWKEEVKAALARSVIAILLISADYLASDFVYNDELPPLLRAAENRGVRILPVILKPCRFLRDKSLAAFQAVNDPKKPMSSLSSHGVEEIYARVAEVVENETHGAKRL